MMIDNKNHFHLLQEFEQVRSQFSSTMLMEHIPMVLVHLLNMHKCIPDVIVIHVGESDLSQESNKQQRCNVAEMTVKLKKLPKSVDTHLAGQAFTLIWFHCLGTWARINKEPLKELGQDSKEL